jgi:hypothetical protein
MDYTMNPAGNMHPDLGNFEFLEALYGNTPNNGNSNGNSTGGGSGGDGGTLGDDSAAETQSTSGVNRQNAAGGDGGDGYETPSWLKTAWDTVSTEFSSGRYRDGSTGTSETGGGWRLLHSRGNIRAHQLDVGAGYSIVVHVLLADHDGSRDDEEDRKLLRFRRKG